MPSQQRWQVPGAVPWLRFNLEYVPSVYLGRALPVLGRSLHFLEEHDTLDQHFQNPTVYLYALALFCPRSLRHCCEGTGGFVEWRAREATVADTVGDRLEVIAEGRGNVKGLRLRLSSL